MTAFKNVCVCAFACAQTGQRPRVSVLSLNLYAKERYHCASWGYIIKIPLSLLLGNFVLFNIKSIPVKLASPNLVDHKKPLGCFKKLRIFRTLLERF